jgi:hypothetical protein
MTALATRLAARRVIATPRRRSRRILAWRLGRVARRTLDLALKLGDPLLLPRDALLQPLDLLFHPQQHGDHDLAALVVDRLRLRPLHTTRFDGPALCPPTHCTLTESPAFAGLGFLTRRGRDSNLRWDLNPILA